MKGKSFGSMYVAASVLAFGVGITAQGAGQQPSQPQTQPQTQPSTRSTDQQITLTGCVQRESEYRRAQDAGRGGVAGTGVGVGNEFVLTEASSSSATTAGARPAEPTNPTGTGGTTASAKMAYELTGPNEGQVGQYVGRRVEISGTLKAAETTAGGQPTGGATAGQPPRGVDVMSKDLKLRELEVTSVKEATGTCPAMK